MAWNRFVINTEADLVVVITKVPVFSLPLWPVKVRKGHEVDNVPAVVDFARYTRLGP